MTVLSAGLNTFDTTGATSVTTPSAGTIQIEVQGGGGGGNITSGAHSGGGGACSVTTSITVTSGQTIWLNVPAGGAVGSSGGDAWVNANANTAPTTTSDGALAKGGTSVSGGAGQGGVAASGVGDTKFSGGNGV